MPDYIVNRELYADRTVQDWHRSKFPRDWAAFDLDLVGVCPKCKHSLYLIESTTNPQKFTTYLYALAEDSDVPAVLILHDKSKVLRGRLIHPWTEKFADEAELVAFLTQLRDGHLCEYRRNNERAAS